jgi:hypothetical protein
MQWLGHGLEANHVGSSLDGYQSIVKMTIGLLSNNHILRGRIHYRILERTLQALQICRLQSQQRLLNARKN